MSKTRPSCGRTRTPPAAGAKKKVGAGRSAQAQALGRSRGGLSTKALVRAADEDTAPAVDVMPGQAGDAPRLVPLLDRTLKRVPVIDETEAALCRLKDGRLMCVYRVDSNVTYGQTWSSDEGRTWTKPVECNGPMSVEPNLAVLDDDTVLLAGGRPGAKLWINQDRTGKDWQGVDLIKYRYKYQSERAKNGDTTGYNKVALLDESHLFYVYDYGRIPPVARVEVVRITLKRK